MIRLLLLLLSMDAWGCRHSTLALQVTELNGADQLGSSLWSAGPRGQCHLYPYFAVAGQLGVGGWSWETQQERYSLIYQLTLQGQLLAPLGAVGLYANWGVSQAFVDKVALGPDIQTHTELKWQGPIAGLGLSYQLSKDWQLQGEVNYHFVEGAPQWVNTLALALNL